MTKTDPQARERIAYKKQRTRAYSLVQQALLRGDLVRRDACSRCGGSPHTADGRSGIQGHHHRGYDYPLDVEWLCVQCHRDDTPKPKTGGPSLPGEAHPHAKLTDDAVRDIRSKPYQSARVLAERYGIAAPYIYTIRKGTAWRHV